MIIGFASPRRWVAMWGQGAPRLSRGPPATADAREIEGVQVAIWCAAGWSGTAGMGERWGSDGG
jgi:hypothetical protein